VYLSEADTWKTLRGRLKIKYLCGHRLPKSRRFCDVSFSVCCPQYRTLSRPIGTCLPSSFLRPNCLRPAQPRQLRRSVLDRLRDMSCIRSRQRPGLSTAPNPRAICSRSAFNYGDSALNSSSSFIEVVRRSVSMGLYRENGAFRRRWCGGPKWRTRHDSNV
jgi:hypothetical protein